MLLFYLNNSNGPQSRIVRSLYKSYPGDKLLQNTNKFLANETLNIKARMIVFAGIVRGSGLIYKWCKNNKKSFLYIDHAYIDRGYASITTTEEWMRITKDSFNWNKNLFETPERWNLHFAKKYTLQPWNKKSQGKILVLPPSEATKYIFPESVNWMDTTLEQVKQKVDWPIFVRHKPKQPIIDYATNNVTGRTDHQELCSIEEELQDTRLIVSFNSAITVLGTMMGVPSISSPFAASFPISIDINNILNPPEPDRQAWLNQLVHHQFRTSECASGVAWNMLEKYMKV